MVNGLLTRTKVENDRLGCLLKSAIFVIQKAAAPKNGVEFRQRPIGDIRRSLATSHDVWRRRPGLGQKNRNARMK